MDIESEYTFSKPELKQLKTAVDTYIVRLAKLEQDFALLMKHTGIHWDVANNKAIVERLSTKLGLALEAKEHM